MIELFVTGTDTGVGKTVVAAALLGHVASAGRTARAFKPAESGCRRRPDGTLLPADAVFLREAAGAEQLLDEVCPYRFEPAVAPGVAAEAEGVELDFSLLRSLVETERARRPDLLLVEGAGGLLVPFGAGRLAADLALDLGLPLLVVARPHLGTINHTLLTLEAGRARGLRIAGFVFCDLDGTADPDFAASNAREIEHAGDAPYLGWMPHISDLEPAALARAGGEVLRAIDEN